MRFGFSLPVGGDLAAPETMARIALAGEALGYDYATFSDHIVIPTDIQARYPYTGSGEFPAGSRAPRHEQLTAMAFIAGRTTRLGLVSSVMVAPHRPAVLAAKMLATIDVLSGGRLTVGIGAGWLKEEFEALGAPDFAARGMVTDEYIAAFRALWTQAAPEFAGQYVQFSNIDFAPKPKQHPSPPIWIGGESGPALRRVARLGDGWYPIGVNPQHPLDSLSRYRAAVARLHKLTQEAGRDPGAITLAYRAQRFGPALPPLADDGERRLFAGGADDIAADLRALAAEGVSHVDIGFEAKDEAGLIGEMTAFKAGVIEKLQ